MREHERFIRSALAGRLGRMDWREVAKFHARQTALMQHERLVHLLVTLAVALFLLLSGGFLLSSPSIPLAVLAGLFLLLEVGYIIHYFRLENGVQRWYLLSNELQVRAGRKWVGMVHGSGRNSAGMGRKKSGMKS